MRTSLIPTSGTAISSIHRPGSGLALTSAFIVRGRVADMGELLLSHRCEWAALNNIVERWRIWRTSRSHYRQHFPNAVLVPSQRPAASRRRASSRNGQVHESDHLASPLQVEPDLHCVRAGF